MAKSKTDPYRTRYLQMTELLKDLPLESRLLLAEMLLVDYRIERETLEIPVSSKIVRRKPKPTR